MMEWAVKVFLPLGGWGLFFVSFADSSFFPVPPDVLLIPLVLASPRWGLWYAALSTVSSVLGAVFAYLIGKRIGRRILARMASEEKIAWIEAQFKRWGAWAVGVAGFVPIPLYKEFTIASGLFSVNKGGFLVASVLGRGGRFFLLALLLQFYGQGIVSFVSHNLIQTTAVTILGTALLWWATRWIARERREIAGMASAWWSRAAKALEGFVNRRFEVWGEHLLYFLAGWVAFALCVITFGKLAEDLFFDKQPLRGDFMLLRLIHRLMTPRLTKFILGITTLASTKFVLIAAVILVALFAARRHYVKALTVAVLTAGGGGLIELLKLVFHRMRPAVFPPLVVETSYSFPSGHSLIAVSFYGLLVYLILRHGLSRFQKLAAVILGGLLIGLIGLSRIYLGVNWPTDVLGGYVSGAAWLLACILVSEELQRRMVCPNAKKLLLGLL